MPETDPVKALRELADKADSVAGEVVLRSTTLRTLAATIESRFTDYERRIHKGEAMTDHSLSQALAELAGRRHDHETDAEALAYMHDRLDALATQAAALEIDVEQWRGLWKKALLAVLDLQAELADYERRVGELKGERDEARDTIAAALELARSGEPTTYATIQHMLRMILAGENREAYESRLAAGNRALLRANVHIAEHQRRALAAEATIATQREVMERVAGELHKIADSVLVTDDRLQSAIHYNATALTPTDETGENDA